MEYSKVFKEYLYKYPKWILKKSGNNIDIAIFSAFFSGYISYSIISFITLLIERGFS